MSSTIVKQAKDVTPSLKKRAHQYLEIAGLEGGLVGLSVGITAWDVRPVVVQDGAMVQLRILGPLDKIEPGLAQQRKDFFQRISKAFPSHQYGEDEEMCWIIRPYVDTTLSDHAALEKVKASLQIVDILSQLAETLTECESHNVTHGHICASNLFLENNKVQLHDYGAAVFSPLSYSGSQKLFAPEVFEEAKVTPAADLFSFALFVKATFPKTFEKHREFFAQMLAPKPEDRPTAKQLKEYCTQMTQFFPEKENDTLRMYISDLGLSFRKSIPKQLIQLLKQLTSQLYKGLTNGMTLLSSQGKRSHWLVICALIGIVLFYSLRTNYEELWRSGDAEKRSQVADAAVTEGSSRAQKVILASARKGEAVQGVAATLLERAFSLPWADNYTDNDLHIIYAVALSGLLTEAQEPPNFTLLSPGALVALVGALPIEKSAPWYADISIERFEELQEPYSELFRLLQEQGVVNLEDLRLRAALRLLYGAVDAPVLKVYFGETLKNQSYPPLLSSLLDVLGEGHVALANVMDFFLGLPEIDGWFAQPSINRWEEKSPLYKLRLIAGELDMQTLPDQEVIDLLSLPLRSIRPALMKRMIAILNTKSLMPTVAYLASKRNTLSRDQTISLILALRVQDKSSHALIEQWFLLEPKEDAVISLLLARGATEAIDFFTVKAAEYLKDRPWKASLPGLAALAKHPEPLIRALAYSKLNGKKKEHRKVLQSAFTAEKDPQLRKTLQKKIEKKK